jgi:uncharacterized repeat protein (TIGR03803 family)
MKPSNKFYLILILCLITASSFGQCYDIYGLSSSGGEYGAGAIVKTDENGNSREVYSFYRIDTWTPNSEFCKAEDGSLYAVSHEGGNYRAGVLFQWDPETNIYSKKINFKYSDSIGSPYGSLIQGQDGSFYGMTTPFDEGADGSVIFEWDRITGYYTVRYQFESETGKDPLGSLLQTENGLMYGLASHGGQNNCGVLFEWDPESGIYRKLIDFDTIETGFDARSSLCLADNGNLFGVTRCGGIHGHGVLFEYDPATDIFSKRLDFNGNETGSHPESSLTMAENGKLYGTTFEGGLYGYGVLFQWDPSNNEFNKLLDFNNAEKGRYPVGPLTLYENGILVGVTLSSVFEFDTKTNLFTKKCNFGSLDLRPISSLTRAENGKFYGFSGRGGLGAIMRPPFYDYGVIYEWDPVMDTCSIRLRFMDKPAGAGARNLVSYDGKFYGTSKAGDSYCNLGVIFEFDPEKGTIQKVTDLNTDFTKAINPGPLMKSVNGNFYGWTGEWNGECAAYQSLFEWNPSKEQYTGKYIQYFSGCFSYPKGPIPLPVGQLVEAKNQKIYYGSEINSIVEWDLEQDTLIMKNYLDEDINGKKPQLILSAKNGKLLGITESGGLFNRGTLFEWDPSTYIFNKLLEFTDSIQLSYLFQLNDSLFYGASNIGSLGLFYEWNQESNAFSIKYKFNNIDHYERSLGEDLTLADNGKLYGTLNTADSGYYFFEWDPVNNSLKRIFDLEKSDNYRIRYRDIVVLNRYSRDTIRINSCNVYVSPSGKYAWSESGVYLDTLQCATGCDSVLTINLTIHYSSEISINETSCDSYKSPSGKIWTQSGIYADTLSGINGCDSIITVTLTIQTVDTSVTQNQSVLFANASEATYQWIDCDKDNTLLEGETHQSYAATADGNYAVIVSQNGCIDTSVCFAVSITGLIVNTFKHNLTLYPNPTEGSFTIDLGSNYSKAEITITQMDGRIISEDKIINGRYKDLQISASPGIYMVIITSENKRAVFKLSKK